MGTNFAASEPNDADGVENGQENSAVILGHGIADITPSASLNCLPLCMFPTICTLPSIANAVGKVAGVAIYSPVGNQTLNAGTYVEIGCDSSYYLSGGSNMTCQANGTFDSTPSCVPLANCTLPFIANLDSAQSMSNMLTGIVDSPFPVFEIAHGAPLQLLCDPGYIISFNTNLTCSNGSLGALPTCNG